MVQNWFRSPKKMPAWLFGLYVDYHWRWKLQKHQKHHCSRHHGVAWSRSCLVNQTAPSWTSHPHYRPHTSCAIDGLFGTWCPSYRTICTTFLLWVGRLVSRSHRLLGIRAYSFPSWLSRRYCSIGHQSCGLPSIPIPISFRSTVSTWSHSWALKNLCTHRPALLIQYLSLFSFFSCELASTCVITHALLHI